MDLDEIKAQLDRIFASGSRSDSREQAAGLRDALVQFKVGINQLTEVLARSERELAAAQQEAGDYARRGQLAAEINDQETVRIAGEFAAKVQERIDLLQRKVLVQRDELTMAQRDYEATKQQYQNASRGIPLERPVDPLADPERISPLDQVMMDQRAREAAVEAQLAHLKKKLGEKR